MSRLPVLFVSDLGPFPAFEKTDYTDALEALGRSLGRPKAVLVMSGHWEAWAALGVTSSPRPGIEYDYGGFPPEFYKKQYPAPGDPETARKAVDLLREAGFEAEEDPARKLDHGAWVPLTRLFPKADVPVVQLTVPSGWEPARIAQVGRALAPLREGGALIVASGALIHNLRKMRFDEPEAEPDDWAVKFDAWLGERLPRSDASALADYRTQAPGAALAAPTTEHFDPLFFALGAADGDAPKESFHRIVYGNALLRLMRFG